MVGGLGSLDEATTVACPEAVTLLGSMDDPAGSRSEVEVEVEVCGGGPIEEDEVLVLAVGAVAGNIDLVGPCAGAELVAFAEVAGGWPAAGLLEEDGCPICEEGGEDILLTW